MSRDHAFRSVFANRMISDCQLGSLRARK